jgi:hypothetical protein
VPDTYPLKGVAAQSDPAIGATAFAAATDYASLVGNVRGVYVATTGTLQCVMADGSAVTFAGLLAGVVYPFVITSIVGSGTTATGHVLR